MGRLCPQVRLRAERRLGELLGRERPAGQSRLQLFPSGHNWIAGLGITRKQSSKWQAVATLPAAEFERYLSTAAEPTTAGLLRLVQVRERSSAGGPARGGQFLTGPASRLWDKLADDSVDLFLPIRPTTKLLAIANWRNWRRPN